MSAALQRPYVRAVVLALLWVALFALLIRSLDVAFAWWKGEIAQPRARDGLWIALLPVWIFVYLRWFSIFRPGCQACAAKDDPPIGPRGA